MNKIGFYLLLLVLAPAAAVIVITPMDSQGNDSKLLIVFYVQIMPDDFIMQLHRF